MTHVPVLLNEALEALAIKKDGIYVDATFGRGGHSYHILSRLSGAGHLYSFDTDLDAVETSKEKAFQSPQFTLIHSNFAHFKEQLNKRGIEKIDGALFDLGVSSPQLDTASRGFSFHLDGRLDMRMDQSQNLSCYEVVNSYSERELTEIFQKFGEERYAKGIAKGIINQRKKKFIETTLELVDVIRDSVPAEYKRTSHPARKVFQALRIYVNSELTNVQIAIEQALSMLNIGGRLAVISFHSLEDRIVKQAFSKAGKEPVWNRNMPVLEVRANVNYRIISKKVIIPSEEEMNKNPRSQSAKMRIIERIR